MSDSASLKRIWYLTVTKKPGTGFKARFIPYGEQGGAGGFEIIDVPDPASLADVLALIERSAPEGYVGDKRMMISGAAAGLQIETFSESRPKLLERAKRELEGAGQVGFVLPMLEPFEVRSYIRAITPEDVRAFPAGSLLDLLIFEKIMREQPATAGWWDKDTSDPLSYSTDQAASRTLIGRMISRGWTFMMDTESMLRRAGPITARFQRAPGDQEVRAEGGTYELAVSRAALLAVLFYEGNPETLG